MSEDFQTLNVCLHDAIAGAVAELGRQREPALSVEGWIARPTIG